MSVLLADIGKIHFFQR